MKSVYDLINENRQELIAFLKNHDDKYTFAHYDNEEEDWCDDEGPVDLGDVCPFVVCDNDNGIGEYAVISIQLINGTSVEVTLVNPYDYEDTFTLGLEDLYGASECYIYEIMMDII